MKTDDLIHALAADAAPVPNRAPQRALLLTAAAGIVVALLLVLGWLERWMNLKPLFMNYTLVSAKPSEEMVAEVNKVLDDLSLTLSGIKLGKAGERQRMVFTIDGTRIEHKQLMEQFRQLPDIQAIEAVRGPEHE